MNYQSRCQDLRTLVEDRERRWHVAEAIAHYHPGTEQAYSEQQWQQTYQRALLAFNQLVREGNNLPAVAFAATRLITASVMVGCSQFQEVLEVIAQAGLPQDKMILVTTVLLNWEMKQQGGIHPEKERRLVWLVLHSPTRLYAHGKLHPLLLWLPIRAFAERVCNSRKRTL